MKRSKMNLLGTILVIVITGLILNGCAAMKKDNTQSTEQLLSAAGFNMHPADTAEKMAHLQTLPQLKLVAHQKDNKMYYIYADAQYSKALYIGTEQAYQKYQNLSEQKNIAEMQENAAMMAPGWGVWGPVW